MKKIIVVCASMLGLSAYAGNDAGHGGHGVQCFGKPTVTLDYYHASLPNISGGQRNIYNPDINPKDVIPFILGRLKLGALDMAFQITWQEVGDIESWKATTLKMLEDHKIPYSLPSDCKLLQAAVRENNVQYGVRTVIDRLSKGQQQLLRVHEALYLMYQNAGGTTSMPVRNLLNTVLDLDATDSEIKAAIYRFSQITLVEYACKATCYIYGRAYDKVDTSKSAQYDMQKASALNPSAILQEMNSACHQQMFSEQKFLGQYSGLCPAHLWGQFGCIYERIITPETNCVRVK